MHTYPTPFTLIGVDKHPVLEVVVSNKNDYLLSATQRCIHLWTLPNVRLCGRDDLGLSEDIETVAYHHDSGQMLVATIRKVYALDRSPSTPQSTTWPDTNNASGVLQFSANGSYLARWTRSRKGQVWQWRDGLSPVTLDGCSDTATFAFNGVNGLMAGALVDEVRVWRTSTGEHFATIPHAMAKTICFIADDAVAVASGDNRFSGYRFNQRHVTVLWDRSIGHEIKKLVNTPNNGLIGCMAPTSVILADTSHGGFAGELNGSGKENLTSLVFSPPDLILAGRASGGLIAWTHPI